MQTRQPRSKANASISMADLGAKGVRWDADGERPTAGRQQLRVITVTKPTAPTSEAHRKRMRMLYDDLD